MAWHKVQSLPFNFLLDPLLAEQLNLTYSFFFFFLSVCFLTSCTFLLSYTHRSQNFLFFPNSSAMLLQSHMPSTHTCSLTHTHSLRSPHTDARNVSAALLTQSLMPSSGPWEGQSHRTWHSCTLLLAWLVFLSWLCSGHPGREPGQLLLIPSLYSRTP